MAKPNPEVEKVTREEILSMCPGDELNYFVAEKVMGWTRTPLNIPGWPDLANWHDEEGYEINRKARFFNPSGDWDHAMAVVKKLEFNHDLRVKFEKHLECLCNGRHTVFTIKPELISKAALLSCLVENGFYEDGEYC